MDIKQAVLLLSDIYDYVDSDVYDDNNLWYEGYEELFNIAMALGEKLDPFFYSEDKYDDYDLIIKCDANHYGLVEVHGQGTYSLISRITEVDDISCHVVDICDIFKLYQNNVYPKEVVSIKVLDKLVKSACKLLDDCKIVVDGNTVGILDIQKYIECKILQK